MSTDPDTPPDALLAAEWAFGLLDREERLAVESRRLHDALFARRCDEWVEHAAGLLRSDEVAPPAAMWANIVARLPANDGAEWASMRRSRGRWRAFALMMTAASVGIAALAVSRERRNEPSAPAVLAHSQAPLVVVLTSSDGLSAASVSIDRASGRITVAGKGLDIAQHTAELWAIGPDKVPRSLGLWPTVMTNGSLAVRSAAPGIAQGMTLAVSLEPLGGSPSGKPTGPIIVTGHVEG